MSGYIQSNVRTTSGYIQNNAGNVSGYIQSSARDTKNSIKVIAFYKSIHIASIARIARTCTQSNA